MKERMIAEVTFKYIILILSNGFKMYVAFRAIT